MKRQIVYSISQTSKMGVSTKVLTVAQLKAFVDELAEELGDEVKTALVTIEDGSIVVKVEKE